MEKSNAWQPGDVQYAEVPVSRTAYGLLVKERPPENAGQIAYSPEYLAQQADMGLLNPEVSKPTGSARERLFAKHTEICETALQLMHKKNNDYAREGDPFLNFREFGRFGIAVRMGDKWRRFKHMAEGKEMAIKDESLRDTLLDLINYTVLYLAYED